MLIFDLKRLFFRIDVTFECEKIIKRYVQYTEKEKTPDMGIQYSDRDSYDDLADYIQRTRETSFAGYLDEQITLKKWKPAYFYKKAHLDRRVFWSIMNTAKYQPSKDTAVMCALALELNLEDTNRMLHKAGYCLSHSVLRDVAIEYCFQNRIHNIDVVNEILVSLNTKILG